MFVWQKAVRLCSLLCASALCCCQPTDAIIPEATLAIVGGTLIDGTGGEPQPNTVILVNDKRIVEVGAMGELKVPDGVKTVPATGKYVTPGLIDSNVHLAMNGLSDAKHWVSIAGRFEEYAAVHARVSLMTGLTTVRDTWGPTDALISLRDKIDRGEVEGARIVLSGPIVQHKAPLRKLEPHEEAEVDPKTQELVWAQMECNVEGPVEEGREEVRRLIAKGIDFVKFSSTGDDYGDEPILPQESLDMIVEEAHRAGLTAESHTMEAEGLRMALLAGADAMQHPEVMTKEMPDDIIDMIVERGVISVPIILALQRHTLELDDPLVMKTLPVNLQDEYERFVANVRKAPERRRKTIEEFQQNFDISIENVRKLISAGAVIAMGTDAGTTKNFHEAANHFEELEWYVELGMTPMEALLSATRNGAQLLRRDDLGVIEPGAIADILVVDGDPLEDIGNMRQLLVVIKEGDVMLDRSASEQTSSRDLVP